MSKLMPCPGGGTLWFVPSRVRPIAETTKGTSDLISLIVADNEGCSLRDVAGLVNFDSDVDTLVDLLGEWADVPLLSVDDGFSVQFASV